jgi:hypothetical protein
MADLTDSEFLQVSPVQAGEARLIQLQSMAFDSFKDLYREVNAQGRAIGFRIGIRRSIRKPGNTEACAYYLECDRGRQAKQRGQGKKASSSRKEGCPWSAKAVCSKLLNQWVLTIRNPTHNHQMSRSVGQIPGFRRDGRNEAVLKDIENLSRQPALTAADIADQIQAAHSIRILPKDVSNEQQKMKEAMFEGRTAFQQFIYELEADPTISKRIGRQGNNSAAKIDRIFWTYRQNIDLWKANWVVISIDNTYKVNRHNMPLCQINGITALHTTFPVAYCLVSGEREEIFSWVLGQLKDIATAEGIPDPLVIISDFDKAFKRAARSVYGSSQHQICLWHVMKNVAFNVKKKWNGPLEGSVLVEAGNGAGNNIPDDDVDDIDESGASRDPGDDSARADNSRMAVAAATRLLEPSDQSIHLSSQVRNAHTATLQAQSTGSSRKYVDNPDGILLAWKAVVYADTEDDFWAAWSLLKAEFAEQPGRLDFVFSLCGLNS